MGNRVATAVVTSVGVLTASLLSLFVAQRATRPIGAGDVFWQLRAGQTILETGSIPDTDTYSYTIAGSPWNNHEWLYEAALAAWHQLTGWFGVRIMVLLVITATLLTIVWPWLRSRRLAMAVLQASIAVVLIGYKIIPAPQTLAMWMLFIGYRAFLREDLLTNRKRYAALCLFMLVFGNLTAESLMFIPFLFADQLGRAWNAPRRWPRIMVWLALPSVLLTVSPPESSIIEYVLMRGQSINAEFARLWDAPLVISSLGRSLGWTIIAAYAVFQGVRMQRGQLNVRDAALGMTAVAGAMLFQRNLFLLIVPAEQMLRAWPRHDTRMLPQIAATLAAAGLVSASAHVAGWQPTDSAVLAMPAYWDRNIDARSNPVGCIGAVQRLPEGSRTFTKHLWASYLILQAPNTRIFVDGRNREYPLAVHRAAFQIERGGLEALRLLDASGTQWVLSDPAWLSRVPRGVWTMQGRSDHCALFGRITALPGSDV